jgi:hypothetical protein
MFEGAELGIGWPSQGEEEDGGFGGADRMRYGGGQGEELASAEVVGFALGLKLDGSAEDVDGEGAVGVVFGEFGTGGEGEKDDADVGVFEEHFGGDAGFGGWLLLEVGDFAFEVEVFGERGHVAVFVGGGHG